MWILVFVVLWGGLLWSGVSLRVMMETHFDTKDMFVISTKLHSLFYVYIHIIHRLNDWVSSVSLPSWARRHKGGWIMSTVLTWTRNDNSTTLTRLSNHQFLSRSLCLFLAWNMCLTSDFNCNWYSSKNFVSIAFACNNQFNIIWYSFIFVCHSPLLKAWK